MAVGAGEQYWGGRNLPSLLKHEILRRYLPIFLARTSKPLGRVVVVDAYAGRGVYEDGKLGSAGMMLKWALEKRNSSHPSEYILHFLEKDRKNFEALSAHVETYSGSGIDVVAERADAIVRVEEVVAAAIGLPLFLFVDPTGVGLPFDVLVSALTRPMNRRSWPPTEVLINFSWEAVRRIGGHVRSKHRNETTLATLDRVLGGDWWQQHFSAGVSDDAVMSVVEGFEVRLQEAARIAVLSVPVRRDVTHKPIYSLIFATRNSRGAWHFGDATAKSLADWRKAVDENFERLDLSPTRAELEAAALPDVESSLLDLVARRGEIVVG